MSYLNPVQNQTYILGGYLYTDPGSLDTIIGKINAPGLVCDDGADECAGLHRCKVWKEISLFEACCWFLQLAACIIMIKGTGQKCINTIGTYDCGCDEGYECNSKIQMKL